VTANLDLRWDFQAADAAGLNEARVFIGSDLLYDDDVTDELVSLLEQLLLHRPDRVCYLTLERRMVFTVAEQRVTAPAYDYFKAALARTPLTMRVMYGNVLDTDTATSDMQSAATDSQVGVTAASTTSLSLSRRVQSDDITLPLAALPQYVLYDRPKEMVVLEIKDLTLLAVPRSTSRDPSLPSSALSASFATAVNAHGVAINGVPAASAATLAALEPPSPTDSSSGSESSSENGDSALNSAALFVYRQQGRGAGHDGYDEEYDGALGLSTRPGVFFLSRRVRDSQDQQ